MEHFHSCGQWLCKFTGTKESVYTGKEFNSQWLGYLHARRDVMLKRSISGENFLRIFEDP